jgi:hypothetical protein
MPMDQEAFYKDQYDRSLDRKNEINGSLSTPISILTALIAGLYFASTNFNFKAYGVLSIMFLLIALLSLLLLALSIYHLIRAFSDFHNGYNYAYLNDANVLNEYHQGLITFYKSRPGKTILVATDEAKQDFDGYILNELIKSAGINQKNNKSKTFQRFQCHHFMIYALITLSLLIIPFGINFGLTNKGERIRRDHIDYTRTTKIVQAIKENKSLKLKSQGNGRSKKTDSSTNTND